MSLVNVARFAHNHLVTFSQLTLDLFDADRQSQSKLPLKIQLNYQRYIVFHPFKSWALRCQLQYYVLL